MRELTHLDLFSGIGGFSLAFEAEGFRTIAFCESDDYAQRTLIKNFGAVMADAGCEHGNGRPPEQRPFGNQEIERNQEAILNQRCGEVVANTKGQRCEETGPEQSASSNPARIYSDIRKLDGAQFRGVTVLTAGVPCQPASQAGKRRGTADDRWLWPEALRILRESMPAWAIFENPPGILSLESGVVFERCLSEMESYGYTVQPIIVPACAVNAKHRRDRVWIVAHRDEPGPQGRNGRELQERSDQWIARTSNPFPYSTMRSDEQGSTRSDQRELENSISEGNKQSGNGCAKSRLGGMVDGLSEALDGCYRWPEEDSETPRVAQGVKNRVYRLRCLGNAIVPQVAQIFAKDIKKSIQEKSLLTRVGNVT